MLHGGFSLETQKRKIRTLQTINRKKKEPQQQMLFLELLYGAAGQLPALHNQTEAEGAKEPLTIEGAEKRLLHTSLLSYTMNYQYIHLTTTNMKKEYLYLIIAGIVIYIISQNRKDEENNRQIGGGYIPAVARITPIQFPETPNTTETIRQIDNDRASQGAKVKVPNAGEGLIS